MPSHQFDVIIKGEIELHTQVDADTEAEALELANLELRNNGEISNVVVERNMMLDAEEEIDLEMLRIADNHSRLPNG